MLGNNTVIIKKTIESLGSIVLSPPQSELKAVDVKRCKEYDKPMNCRQCHAEVSILSSLAKKGCLKPEASLLFNINWTADPDKLKMLCTQCHNLMKEVSHKRKVDIAVGWLFNVCDK